MEDIANIIYQLLNIQLNNNMTKIINIYASISGYFLQVVIIHRCQFNSPYSMLDHPDFNDVSIGTYKRVRFPTNS